MTKKSEATVPSYTYEPTSNKNLMRFCDMKGDWQYYWMVKEKRFVKAVNHVLSLGHAKGPNFMSYISRSTPEEIKKVLDEKGDEGSRTHMAIRDLISGLKVSMSTKYATELKGGRQEILNMDEWDNLMGFRNWCAKYHPRTVANEDTLDNGYSAGTLDYLCVITIPAGDKEFEKWWWGKDVLMLVDWKSSSGIWPEYEAQTAAYWDMVKCSHKYDKFIKAYAGNIFTAVVRLGTRHKSKYEFASWDQKTTEGEHLLRYESARLQAERQEPEFIPDIQNIPIQMFIRVPKAKVVAKKKVQIKK
jgi:hypothetical protein